ncbi:MAG: aldose 1-epimerase family protein [Planctomycetota bacterium]|nr:aldose 1-epimerase family protein [Planctomycetota bacterium]
MATLFGRKWKREELARLIGNMSQLCGVEVVSLTDGPGRGARVARFRTGGGLAFDVAIDRGMDIPAASFRDASLCWHAPCGHVAPAFYEPEGNGWLRGFFGGLLTTCGLTQAGAACTDQGSQLGLHGRYSYIPAELLACGGEWRGGEYAMRIKGRVREGHLYGPNLVLTREISAMLGGAGLCIRDEVVNEGFEPSPLMILYHINLGFPILGPGSRIVAPSLKATPRDAVAAQGLPEHDRIPAPTTGFKEHCIFHEMAADGEGKVTVLVTAPPELAGAGIARGLYVIYDRNQLPRFTEWKMVGEGAYVLGIEPANCLPMGRAHERAAGTLESIQPGQVRRFDIEIGILTDDGDVAKMAEGIERAKAAGGKTSARAPGAKSRRRAKA